VALVFTRTGGQWAQDKKLVGAGAVGKSAPSLALSADGSVVILGASNDNGGVGAAWVFTRSGSYWSQDKHLVGSGAAAKAALPASVDSSIVIVGRSNDNGGTGAATVFTRRGGGSDSQVYSRDHLLHLILREFRGMTMHDGTVHSLAWRPAGDGGPLCAHAAGPAHPFVRRRVSLRGVAASRLPRPTITAWDCLLPQSPWRALGSSESPENTSIGSRSLPIADALEIYGSRRLMLLTETPSRMRSALQRRQKKLLRFCAKNSGLKRPDGLNFDLLGRGANTTS
jgi:hypothetical protein